MSTTPNELLDVFRFLPSRQMHPPVDHVDSCKHVLHEDVQFILKIEDQAIAWAKLFDPERSDWRHPPNRSMPRRNPRHRATKSNASCPMRSAPRRLLGDRSLCPQWECAEGKCGTFPFSDIKFSSKRRRRVDAGGETHFDGHGDSHWLVDLQKKDLAEVSRTNFFLQQLQLSSNDGHSCAVVVECDRLFINCGTKIEEWKTIESRMRTSKWLTCIGWPDRMLSFGGKRGRCCFRSSLNRRTHSLRSCLVRSTVWISDKVGLWRETYFVFC